MSKQNAIVTGAASGLGAAIVRRFVKRRDISVLGLDLDGDGLDQLERELGEQFRGIRGDLTDPATAARAMLACSGTFGPVDILVNNVGAGKGMPVHETSDDSLDFFLDINLKTTFRMSRAALTVMMQERRGVIVNVASAIALTELPGQGAYAAAKGGVIALTRQMAVEYGPYNIRVNAIAPGLIETPFTAGRIHGGMFDGVVASTPLRRLGRPEDIAAAVDFFSSADSVHVTGQVIAIDGGWSMSKI